MDTPKKVMEYIITMSPVNGMYCNNLSFFVVVEIVFDITLIESFEHRVISSLNGSEAGYQGT
jgi:hypothetical protein